MYFFYLLKSSFLIISGYYKEYSPTCNPTIVTEFAAAAFRFGHSLLRPHLPRLSPNYQPVDPPILLRDGFFKPDMFMSVRTYSNPCKILLKKLYRQVGINLQVGILLCAFNYVRVKNYVVPLLHCSVIEG